MRNKAREATHVRGRHGAKRAATASAPRTAARPRRGCGRAAPGKGGGMSPPSLPSGKHLDTVRDIGVGLAHPLGHFGQMLLNP